jgi:hypothetical protein
MPTRRLGRTSRNLLLISRFFLSRSRHALDTFLSVTYIPHLYFIASNHDRDEGFPNTAQIEATSRPSHPLHPDFDPREGEPKKRLKHPRKTAGAQLTQARQGEIVTIKEAS